MDVRTLAAREERRRPMMWRQTRTRGRMGALRGPQAEGLLTTARRGPGVSAHAGLGKACVVPRTALPVLCFVFLGGSVWGSNDLDPEEAGSSRAESVLLRTEVMDMRDYVGQMIRSAQLIRPMKVVPTKEE